MRLWLLPAACAGTGLLLLGWAQSIGGPQENQLLQYRNLGKAFYENPTTQAQAVDQFRKAMTLKPNSAIERLNYGLALLRAGKTAEGIAELEKVQKQQPDIPHTWFNLGIEFKKSGEHAKAVRQFEQMVKLVPDEPVSHYNLGVLYKLLGRTVDAIREFETALKLDPNLAAPHFQLYNAYRQAGRREDATKELQTFQLIKKRTEGAAVPEDMEWSFYSEIYDPIEPRFSADSSTPAPLKFEDKKLPGSVDATTAHVESLDLDGDDKADLLVWSSQGIRLYKGGVQPVEDSGLGASRNVTAAAAGDFDNDGSIDLAVIAGGEASLWKNAKGKFTKVEAKLPVGAFTSAVWLDYDHDYDLDLVLLGDASTVVRNEGAAGFADRPADIPFVKAKAVDGVAFRLIADTKSTDLLVSYADRPGVIYRDMLQSVFKAEDVPALPASARSLTAYDFNNDIFFDVAFVDGKATRLLRNAGGKLEPDGLALESRGFAFADLENRGLGDLVAAGTVSRNLGGKFAPAKQEFGDGVAWTRGDFDADAKMDLAGVYADGSIHQLHNTTATNNSWVRIKIAGVKNMVLAPGAEVEVKAGPLYQKRTYEGLPLLFGTRNVKRVDTVRITWPNGLIQNEPQQPTDKLLDYKEAQRLSGSCPIIWTWNGKEFEYITDVLGVAPLGAASGEGRYLPVDHDEYVYVGGNQLKAVEGKYEVRITEELSEVAYLDQIRLLAVDYPASVDIFQNDKWKGPPFPEFRLFGVKSRVYPKTARDDRGRDVLSRLLAKDEAYPDEFPRSLTGVAGMHALELDFGRKSARDGKAVMVMSGWVDWADGSTFFGVAQEKRGGLVPPYLQVRDAKGAWKTVIEDMGMPAGKPKTIVVDLSGKWLSSSREVRIVTNLCVYWDEIFLSGDTGEPDARLTDVAASEAEVRFRGFSRNEVHPQRKQPERFFYAESMPTSLWNPTPGLYTRYGDVEPLLSAVDDKLVVMGSGDEIRLRFDSAKMPRLPAGWRRDFLLKVDGWAKDRDANTAYSQTVEPLPFHRMSQYPYGPGERYPDDQEHQLYRQKYNNRPALRLIRPLTADRSSRPWKPMGVGTGMEDDD